MGAWNDDRRVGSGWGLSVDAWLTRLYTRFGAWYAAGAIGLPVLIALVLVPVTLGFPASYLGLTFGEWFTASAASNLCVIAAIGIAVTLLWRRIGPLFAWSGGRRPPELAASADQWAFRGVRRTIVVTVALIALSVPIPIVVALGQSSYSTAADIVGLSVAWFALTTLMGLTGYVLIEFLLGPVRASLHRHDLPETSAPGLATALLATPLVIMFLIATGVSYATLERDAGADELLRAFAIAAGLTAIGAIPFVLVVFGGVLDPLRRLIDGHRAVGAGDHSRIDVVSANELGELTASFNQMVDGLEERESLRGENVELVEELRASRARIVSASDEARRKVERDLHDGAQQNLVLLNLKLGLVERKLDRDPASVRALVDDARAELDRALDELRDLAHGIYPQVLTSDGLPGALAEAVEQAPMPAQLECDGARRYPPELEAAIYFCCLEALQNAAKHAGAGARVAVSLREVSDALAFEVADDGVGFDPASANGSAGLQNMADRIGALGGELRIESTPGMGTTIAGSVPVEG